MAPPREELNRPLTSAEFDPRKHIIFSTKAAKKEYKKRGMKLVSDAEKRRIARIVELEQRAEKIREKEERKKKNALKRKAKEDKEKEKGIMRVPKKLKVTSSQPKLMGFLQSRRKNVKVEEEEENDDEEEDSDQEQQQEQSEDSDEMEEQDDESEAEEEIEDSDDDPEPRRVLGEQDANVVRSRGRPKKFLGNLKTPPPLKRKRGRPKKATPPSQWRRNPEVPTIEEDPLEEEEEDIALPWDATCKSAKTSPVVNRKLLQLQSIHSLAYKPAGVAEAVPAAHDPSQRGTTPCKGPTASSRAPTDSPKLQSLVHEAGEDERDLPELGREQLPEGIPQDQEAVNDVQEQLLEISDLEDDFDDIPEDVLAQCEDVQSPINEVDETEAPPPDSPTYSASADSPHTIIDDNASNMEDEDPAVPSCKSAAGGSTTNSLSKVITDDIPDSQDEFELLDDDDLLEASESAVPCEHAEEQVAIKRVATPVKEEQAVRERSGSFKRPTQHVFSLSPLDPSLPSSPEKPAEVEKKTMLSHLPQTPNYIPPAVSVAQSPTGSVDHDEPASPQQDKPPPKTINNASINHDDDDDDDFFSSSFPMTQCENIILSAQTRTPARTYPQLPTLDEDEEESEMLPLAPAVAPTSAPAAPLAEPSLNKNASFIGALGSSFFDDDCVLTDEDRNDNNDDDDDDATIVDESILTPQPQSPPPPQQPQNSTHSMYSYTGNINEHQELTDYDDDFDDNDIPPSAQPPRPAESDEYGSFELSGSVLMAVMATPSRAPPPQPANIVEALPQRQQQQAPSSSYGNFDDLDDDSMLVLDHIAAVLGSNASAHAATGTTGGAAAGGCASQASSSSYGDCDFTAEEASILDYIGA